MTKQSPLAALYMALALIGMILCLRETSHYAGLGLGYIEANIAFWRDLMVNAASRAIFWDILIMYLAASAFILVESRRLKMRFAWAYIVFGYLIAIAATFPLFLYFRERKLRASHP